MAIKKVGYIGLGVMGRSMAKNLKKAGFELTVFNRSAGPAEELVSEGMKIADSPKELAENVDAVLICVTDGAAVSNVLFGEKGVLASNRLPSLVVDFSTISPSDAKKHLFQVN